MFGSSKMLAGFSFKKSDPIFTETGIAKLKCFHDSLITLQTKIAQGSVHWRSIDGTDPTDLDYNFLQQRGELFSEPSIKLLQQFIALLAQLMSNNSRSYWRIRVASK